MIDPTQIISDIQVSPEARLLVDMFISPEGVGRRYLFGRNEHSAALSKVINIDGFIDDFAEAGTIWKGKPVVNGSTVPKQAIVVNCVMCNMPVSAGKRIRALGVAGAPDYVDFCNVLPDLVPLPAFISETRTDIRQNPKKWQALSSSLHDDHSRQILDDLLRFRLTGKYSSMTPYSYRLQDQYFEEFLHLGYKEIFVDVGGVDGNTTELFCKRNPNYEKVFFFEPSLSNLAKARSRLSSYRSVEFIQLGLSDSFGKLWFNPDGGSSSSISKSGSCQIDVTTLDEYVDRKVTFIKMDIEGWELKALQGAKRHIIADHPKLAIAVYHHPEDFHRIFEFIFSLRKDYEVFLRHYTEGWSETVMYFVPR